MTKSNQKTQTPMHGSASTQLIRQQGNRLKSEHSLYLRQHAYNPIDWYPWGQEAIEKARKDDKPIFLSIGYSSCHWCHVMEHEVFSDDNVAEFMNENYVCIKVDREERPDLDTVYMEALHALTGTGGWPMSVFLTSSLKPFYGGTYFPCDQFLLVAQELVKIYRRDRDKIEDQARHVEAIIADNPNVSPASEITFERIEQAAQSAKDHFDEEWGGLGERTKFPVPVRWQFLLHYYRKTGDEQIARMIKTTLEHMATGGIRDHIGGGFHRYAVERTWVVPHFEKMLYDNAQLANLYLEAGLVFGDGRNSEVARDTLNFIISELGSNEGGFFSSIDADSDGKEGFYYLWSVDDIVSAVGGEDGPILARLLGIIPDGDFDGKSVVTRRADPAEVAREYGRSAPEIASLFDRHREKLRAYRMQRNRPGLDTKMIAGWNGMAISALARCYAVCRDERYFAAAQKTANYVWQVHHRGDGQLFRASSDGRGENEAVLEDYAHLADGLIELYQVSGTIEYLRRALLLLDFVRNNFRAQEAGYYYTPQHHETPLGRKTEIFDSVLPSGNSSLLQVLLKAGALAGKPEFHEEVRHQIKSYAGVMEKAGLEMAWWFDVALRVNGPYLDVVIAGDLADRSTQSLLSCYWRISPPYAVLAVIPADGLAPQELQILPVARGKTAIDNKPTVYVCQFGVCALPTHDPVTFCRRLTEGWAYPAY